MKTVLIISNVTGGLYSFRRELLEELVKSYRVVILASDNGRVDKMTALGCEFIPTDLDRHGTNPIKELKLISLYKKYIRDIKPDIVLTYTIKCNIYAGMACAALKVPYVANITGLGTALENPGMLQKIITPLYRRGLRKAQMVFFQNEENRDFMLSRKIVKTAWDLLPGSGVSLENYKLLPYPKEDTVHFTFISRVMKEKGIDQYLDAAKYIREKYPNTCFHVCGNCEENYAQVLQQLHDAGVINYHGRIDDISGMHSISSCTIHPTYYPEGMSNVLLESAACGRPIITTDRSGCREIVDDGSNGFVVKQKDSADLIEKVEKFLALTPQQREAMGIAGRKKVEQQFDRRIVIEKYLRQISAV